MDVETKIGPFIRSDNKTIKMMLNVLFALIPIIIFSFYKNGIIPYQKGYISLLNMFYPLIFIIIGALSSLLTEEIFMYVFKHKRGKELIDNVINGYGFFPGLFLSLILPINTPLSILFIGAVFATVIGKMIYGGFGNNIFNPALVGAIFIMASFSTSISTNGGYLNSYELDTISSATPLTNVKLVTGLGTYDTLVKPFGNLWDFFFGFIPGAIGETSSLLILCAFLYLTFTKTIKWRIPTTYVGTVFIMTLIIGLFNNTGVWYPLFEILSGGLLFGSVFMATDPVTSPVTPKGQVLYGILLGFMTVLLRYLTSYPEGVMTSILFMNMLVFLFDKVGAYSRFKKLPYYIILGITLLVIISSSYLISTKYIVKDTKQDNEFNIINKVVSDNETIYEVSEKGFGGDIKAKITFDTKEIKTIEIEEENESNERYKLITDSNYINKLINEQSDIENVDTVSSATITSTALKKMVINTINDFKSNTSAVSVTNDNSKVVSKNIANGITTYMIDTDSLNGTMELKVIMRGDNIRTVLPVSYNDTCVTRSNSSNYYTCPEYMDEGYINKLIANQNNLEGVDTVSGATISSSAIKNALILAKKEGSLNG